MFLRIGLVLLIVVWTLGTPGLGIETRTGGDVLGWVYTVTYLAAFLALALIWRGRRFAPALAGAVGAAAAIIAALDLSGVLLGTPPAGIVALDAAAIGIGLGLVAKARLTRPVVA